MKKTSLIASILAGMVALESLEASIILEEEMVVRRRSLRINSDIALQPRHAIEQAPNQGPAARRAGTVQRRRNDRERNRAAPYHLRVDDEGVRQQKVALKQARTRKAKLKTQLRRVKNLPFHEQQELLKVLGRLNTEREIEHLRDYVREAQEDPDRMDQALQRQEQVLREERNKSLRQGFFYGAVSGSVTALLALPFQGTESGSEVALPPSPAPVFQPTCSMQPLALPHPNDVLNVTPPRNPFATGVPSFSPQIPFSFPQTTMISDPSTAVTVYQAPLSFVPQQPLPLTQEVPFAPSTPTQGGAPMPPNVNFGWGPLESLAYGAGSVWRFFNGGH